MSAWAHDVTTILVGSGVVAMLGLTPADPMVGVALLGAAGVSVVLGQRERAKARAERTGAHPIQKGDSDER